MRVTTLVVVMCCALIATGAVAQVEVTVPEVGRVKTTAKVENGILGVANSFTRFRGTARECAGAYFLRTPQKQRFGRVEIPTIFDCCLRHSSPPIAQVAVRPRQMRCAAASIGPKNRTLTNRTG
jgi:hypothetical protein